jgi:hypothetical protein
MRLTLRALLALRHGLLPPSTAAELSGLISESPFAHELLARVQRLSAEHVDQVPADEGPVDANALAAYVDNDLGPTEVTDFETRCLASDTWLAELAAVHQFAVHQSVAQVHYEPALLDASLRVRLQSLASVSPAESAPMPVPPPLPFGSPVSIAMPPGYAPPAMLPASMLSALEHAPAAVGPRLDELPRGFWQGIGNWCGQHAPGELHSRFG